MSDVAQHGSQTYGLVARLPHWLIVVLVAAQFVLGWTMSEVDRDTQRVGLIAWHLAVGAALIAAMAVRIVWPFIHRPPRGSLPPLLDAATDNVVIGYL
ncbi:cytochrome b [Paraburkholderia sp. BR10936]|uniref:cytochrome b n=1 Tax=Paraburkholderia sp. BR10936 TaxID=3236993 RepID=UPI0034D1E16A